MLGFHWNTPRTGGQEHRRGNLERYVTSHTAAVESAEIMLNKRRAYLTGLISEWNLQRFYVSNFLTLE